MRDRFEQHLEATYARVAAIRRAHIEACNRANSGHATPAPTIREDGSDPAQQRGQQGPVNPPGLILRQNQGVDRVERFRANRGQ